MARKKKIDRENSHSLSAIQKQFWLMHEVNRENPAYNLVGNFNLEGKIDKSSFLTAVQRVVERHDILRMVFKETNGEVFQQAAPAPQPALLQIKLDSAGNVNGIALQDFIAQEIRRPFDLENGPAYRFWLIEVSADRFIFLMVIHHIVIDLHSWNILNKEISTAYNALVTNSEDAPLPERLPYSQYVRLQNDWLKSEASAQMERNWKTHLASQSGTLNLPLDFKRSARSDGLGGSLNFEFSFETIAAVRNRAAESRMDPFLILLASYLVTLQKHTCQFDITVGVPLSNRRKDELKDALGCFMNILPIGFELQAEETFDAILRKVRMGMLFAHRNQELPFGNILKTIRPAPVAGMNPVYQVGFAVVDMYTPTIKGLNVTPRRDHNGGAQLDLFLNFWDVSEKFDGYLEYDASLFDKRTVLDFYRRFERAVTVLCTDSGQILKTTDILPPEERKLLVTGLNQTTVPLPEACVHELIEEQVRLSPQKVALECGEDHLSYASVNERANRLAHYLAQSGVAPQTVVGIHLNRSLDMVVAVLAVMKCGAVYLPLDPSFPENRLQYIVDTTALAFMLTETGLGDNLNYEGMKKVHLDTLEDELIHFPSQNYAADVSPSMNAYILFTSGSTGKPKGIPIHHRAVVNFLRSMQKVPGISSSDVLLAVTTLSFDISVLELFLPLIAGAKIVLAKQRQTIDGNQLLQLIEDRNVTVLQATPTTWQMLHASGLNRKRKLKILCGGEAMTSKLAEILCEISDDVWNMFGPTETTVWSTCAKVKPGQSVTIGTPIDNTQIYIATEDLQLCPKGVAGELLIGGLGVGKGYLNRPDLNKEKFGPDPFSGIAGNMVYRTGDLARYRPDGTLEHLGRTDFQVKLRGYRIELSEIENVLSRYPGVAQCAVVLFERNENDKRLVAWMTPTSDSLDTSQIRTFLQKELPDYMVPAAIQTIDQMPLTANGKIDRKKFPTPNFDYTGGFSNFVAPQGELEKIVYKIWQDVLGGVEFGVTDRFFEIGGNSLLAIEAASRVSAAFTKPLSVVDFFEHSTVKALAAYLSRGNENTPTNRIESRIQKRANALASRKNIRIGKA